MHPSPLLADAHPDPAQAARHGDARALAALLAASRADTLASFARLEEALPRLQVPQRPELNPPLWELGHIGWFQGWWTTRAPDAHRGHRAQGLLPRRPGLRPDADALYDSARVPHASRWHLPLPDAARTREELATQLALTLAMLEQGDGDGNGDERATHPDFLYPFRLALLHEDMHHEAALYMALRLGELGHAEVAAAVVHNVPAWQPQALSLPRHELSVAGAEVALGRDADAPGFAFDNECGAQQVAVADFRIDAQAVSTAEFLDFVRPAHYDDPRLWTAPGWRWRQTQVGPAPARAQALAQRSPGAPEATAAAFVSAHEAQAWCRWAGRRLPTEAEWVLAQRQAGAAFRWGDVWEWTASAFAPFAGFVAHPYRDYSAPWFDGRPVLKGASHLTQARLRHPGYRNFFEPERCDVATGLRSCALGAGRGG